jgi:transglutaminase-like putative cysteine protease
VIALALYGYAAGAWPVAAVIAIAVLASLATRWRIALSPGTRRIVLAVATGAGVALGLARTPEPGYGTGTLPGIASAVALAALIPAAARVWIRLPERGYAITFALAIVGVAACGATRLDAPYAIAAIAFFVASIAALRADDPARARWSEQSRRDKLIGAVIGVVTLALGGLIAHALPILYDWAQARFDSTYEFIGFKAELRLGGLDDLKKSDEIVLRVSGDRTDYLRGAVYDRFDARTSSWGLARVDMRTLTFATARPRDAGGVDVRRVGGWGERYFVPLRAGAIGSSAGAAIVDPMGVMRPFESKRYDHYWFDPSAPDELGVVEPAPDDTRLPDRVRAPLEKLVAEWTLPGDTPDVVLAKIARRFDEDYTYSLSFERPAVDPILDFLLANKQGNCEYFASAMALLARAAKIPARVVAGYRVAERNPISGQYIVRQKNAHSWVEAWLPGNGWTTVDPTPASKVEENLARNTSIARALADVASSAFAVVAEWWGRLGPLELAIAAAALSALFVVVRLLRQQRRARRVAASDDAIDDRPLPCLRRLLDALAARGVAHARSEPLERLARRLAEAELREAAALVDRYVALRYGGVGDSASIAREMDRCSADLLH